MHIYAQIKWTIVVCIFCHQDIFGLCKNEAVLSNSDIYLKKTFYMKLYNFKT